MNRFAAEHPEDWEERLDTMTDAWDMRDKTEPRCPTCGQESDNPDAFPDPSGHPTRMVDCPDPFHD